MWVRGRTDQELIAPHLLSRMASIFSFEGPHQTTLVLFLGDGYTVELHRQFEQVHGLRGSSVS